MHSTTLPPKLSETTLMCSNNPLSCSADGLETAISNYQCTTSRSRRLSCWPLHIPKTATKLTSRSRNKSCPSSYSRLLQLIDQTFAMRSDLLLTQDHGNSRTSPLSSLSCKVMELIYTNSKKSTTSGLRPRRKSKLVTSSYHVIS